MTRIAAGILIGLVISADAADYKFNFNPDSGPTIPPNAENSIYATTRKHGTPIQISFKDGVGIMHLVAAQAFNDEGTIRFECVLP